MFRMHMRNWFDLEYLSMLLPTEEYFVRRNVIQNFNDHVNSNGQKHKEQYLQK